jgi:uncharacterized lipoprotein YddW (UPF0748 family)
MKGTDFLKIYLDEAHKRGLQIHCWVQTFYWEVDTKDYPQFPKTTLFDNHPDWKLLLGNGKTTESAEKAHIFANPAIPEVRTLLANYVKELVTNYPVDGINLDYIRYPSGPPDSGYDPYTLKIFSQKYHYSPVDLKVDAKNEQWKQWSDFRAAQVLKTVELLRKAVKSSHPQVVFSAAIFPGTIEEGYTNGHYQNWREMLNRNLLDVIIPMCYAESKTGLKDQFTRVLNSLPNHSKTVIEPVIAVQKNSLDAFSGAQHPPIKDQEDVLNQVGLKSFSIFCYDWMLDSKEGLNLLK